MSFAMTNSNIFEVGEFFSDRMKERQAYFNNLDILVSNIVGLKEAIAVIGDNITRHILNSQYYKNKDTNNDIYLKDIAAKLQICKSQWSRDMQIAIFDLTTAIKLFVTIIAILKDSCSLDDKIFSQDDLTKIVNYIKLIVGGCNDFIERNADSLPVLIVEDLEGLTKNSSELAVNLSNYK